MGWMLLDVGAMDGMEVGDDVGAIDGLYVGAMFHCFHFECGHSLL